MVSMAFVSLLANPFSKTCSLLSDFTLSGFNTPMGLKVTQNRSKNIFFKKPDYRGYLF